MKKLVKTLVLLTAKYCGCFALARFLTRKGIVIIGWHGVSIEDEHARFPQFFVSPSMLAERISLLKKHYEIISLDEAIQMHASGTIKPNTAVLTFDDGLYDFSSVGIPVLQNAGVTATVYVFTSAIDDQISHKMSVQDVFLRAQQARGESPTDVNADQAAALFEHQRRMAKLDEQERYGYLLSLARELNVDFEPVLGKRIWHFHKPHELKRVVELGFDVQVHTHSHKTVVEEPESVFDETRICRERIEAITVSPAVDYCYPSGLWEHSAWEPLRRAGMRSAVTCKVGPNFASTPCMALRRYIDHSANSQLEFESMTSGFEWLLRVLFKPSRFYEPSVGLDGGPPHF